MLHHPCKAVSAALLSIKLARQLLQGHAPPSRPGAGLRRSELDAAHRSPPFRARSELVAGRVFVEFEAVGSTFVIGPADLDMPIVAPQRGGPFLVEKVCPPAEHPTAVEELVPAGVEPA